MTGIRTLPEPRVSGHTRIYGILADPIHHVKTPEVMNALLRDHGVDGILVPMHVAPEGLGALIGGLRAMRNFGGFIATVPHKPAMPPLCDSVTEAAARIGAVNCVRREQDGRMTGAMLDGIGFVEGLRAAGIEVAGRRVLVAGAGGAASAIAFALAEAGIDRLTILNRTIGKAEDLARRVGAAVPGLATDAASGATDPAAYDILVNATSLGMNPDDPLPIPVEGLAPHHVVAEAIMDPVETPLLAAARAAGSGVQPGLPMLEQQIRLMAQHMGAIP